MSKYTSGEIARLCGVTVRTVQYYDTRGILTPSELSDGGRRLYSEGDLQKMKVICFLRSISLPINSIAQILSEDHSKELVSLLLEQQSAALRNEVSEKQAQLEQLDLLSRELQKTDSFSVESIGDVALRMNNRKKLRKVRTTMIIVGVLVEIIEIGLLVLWIRKGIWQPYVIGMVPLIGAAVWISRYYFKNVNYICPGCHTVFKPRFKEAFWASHTPTTRRLTCPRCGRKGFCVETAAEPTPAE